MIYYKYFFELKYRTVLITLTWLSSVLTCYIYKETLLFLMISLSEFQSNTNTTQHFIFTNITELFTVYVNLAFFIAVQAAVISSTYHTLLFLTPSLYLFEYKNALFLVKTFFSVWFSSLCFLNTYLLPLSWDFFISFTRQEDANNFDLFFEAKIDQYFEYYKNFYYACLLSSLIIVLLIVSVSFLKSNLRSICNSRRAYYCFFISIATLITPPDVVSQLFLSFCLSLFYEIFIFVGILNSN